MIDGRRQPPPTQALRHLTVSQLRGALRDRRARGGAAAYNVRLEEAKACALVLIGVRADGSKELVALKDGYRESGESWADLLRDCAPRGQARPGPGGRRRRSRLLKGPGRGLPRLPAAEVLGSQTANVLNALPKSAQPGARRALRGLLEGVPDHEVGRRGDAGHERPASPLAAFTPENGCLRPHRVGGPSEEVALIGPNRKNCGTRQP